MDDMDDKEKKREKRQRALNEIREHIAKFGFHTYVVTGGGDPHFGYTIGLTESLGAELILPGRYFYRLDDVSKVIKSIIGKLSPPVPWDSVSVDADPWGTFSFRRVHMSWATALMLGAFDYYQRKSIEAYQIVPDETHWTIDVPDLSQPWSPNQAPGWRWLKRRMEVPSSKRFHGTDRHECAPWWTDHRGDAMGRRSVGNLLSLRPRDTGIREEGYSTWCSPGSRQVPSPCR